MFQMSQAVAKSLDNFFSQPKIFEMEHLHKWWWWKFEGSSCQEKISAETSHQHRSVSVDVEYLNSFFFSFGFYSVPLRLATSFISILVQSPQVSRLPRLSVNSTDQNDDIQYLPSLWFAVLYGNISGFFSPFLIRWLCFDQKRKPPRRPIIMRWQRAKISLRLKIGILIRRPLAHSLTKPKERDWRIFFFLFSFNRNLQRV